MVMNKYIIIVLFKNGIEKKFTIEGTELGMAISKKGIETMYKDGVNGSLNLGSIFIKVDQTVCIEITKVE